MEVKGATPIRKREPKGMEISIEVSSEERKGNKGRIEKNRESTKRTRKWCGVGDASGESGCGV